MYTHIILFFSLLIIPATAPAMDAAPEDRESKELAAIFAQEGNAQDPIARIETRTPGVWGLNLYNTTATLFFDEQGVMHLAPHNQAGIGNPIAQETLISSSKTSRSKSRRKSHAQYRKYCDLDRGPSSIASLKPGALSNINLFRRNS